MTARDDSIAMLRRAFAELSPPDSAQARWSRVLHERLDRALAERERIPRWWMLVSGLAALAAVVSVIVLPVSGDDVQRGVTHQARFVQTGMMNLLPIDSLRVIARGVEESGETAASMTFIAMESTAARREAMASEVPGMSGGAGTPGVPGGAHVPMVRLDQFTGPLTSAWEQVSGWVLSGTD